MYLWSLQHCHISWLTQVPLLPEVTSSSTKMLFNGSIENITCITQHKDYGAITNQAVLTQVDPLLRKKEVECCSGVSSKTGIFKFNRTFRAIMLNTFSYISMAEESCMLFFPNSYLFSLCSALPNPAIFFLYFKQSYCQSSIFLTQPIKNLGTFCQFYRVGE